MSVTYENRKGDVYHLHQGTTKTGKPKYYFAKREPESPVEAIPEGYEIYESPNGQVFLRRERPKVITDAEVAAVERGMKTHASVKYYLLDVKKNAIVVYTADQDPNDPFFNLSKLIPTANRQRVRELLAREAHYTAMMRFVLVDKEARTFEPERYCFRGRIDDWISIGRPDLLDKLVTKYTPHLGQESFYELY